MTALSRKQDFIRSLLGMTPDQLAHQYQCVGEVMCEEEDHGRAAAGQRTLDMIDAIGLFLHGIAYEFASDRAAGGSSSLSYSDLVERYHLDRNNGMSEE